ncbi:MAG: glycosyltransferase family 4 protein [Hyphomonadaceae bacterium]
MTRDWLADAELDALIAGADLVLAPYRSATQSGVVAQAMAFGAPCVVTPVGACANRSATAPRAGWLSM